MRRTCPATECTEPVGRSRTDCAARADRAEPAPQRYSAGLCQPPCEGLWSLSSALGLARVAFSSNEPLRIWAAQHPATGTRNGPRVTRAHGPHLVWVSTAALCSPAVRVVQIVLAGLTCKAGYHGPPFCGQQKADGTSAPRTAPGVCSGGKGEKQISSRRSWSV